MTHTGIYHGGLVFFGCEDTMMDRCSRIASATLEDYGHPVERQSLQNPMQARITASHYQVKLTLINGEMPSDQMKRSIRMDSAGRLNRGRSDHEEQMQRLVIELCAADPESDDRDISELLLVVMLYRMVDICSVTGIEWLSPNTILTLSQFMGAFSSVSPHRVRGRQEIIMDVNDPRFGSVGDAEQNLGLQYDAISGQKPHGGEFGLIQLTEEETLALAFRADQRPDEVNGLSPEEEAQSDIRRLATWGMTGMMVFLSAPVAASMAAVNLVRGEDFRLNTHVLSLTGLLVMLQSTGALANVMARLPM